MIAIASRATSGASVCSTVTVGGISATKLVSAEQSGGTTNGVSYWAVRVPTGTTADVEVTFSSGQLRAALVVLRADGFDPARVTDTDSIADANTSTRNFTLTNAAGDVVVAAAYRLFTPAATWTDITERGAENQVEGNFTLSAAADIRSSGATDDTFTLTWDGPNSTGAVAASLGLLRPENTSVPTFDADTGDFTVGSWDSFSNGSLLYTVTLKDDADDSTVATLLTSSASTSGNCLSELETAGAGDYYILVRAANDGGFDAAEDTASAVDTFTGGGPSSNLPAIAHHYRQLMCA